jgi:hypothetical protein
MQITISTGERKKNITNSIRTENTFGKSQNLLMIKIYQQTETGISLDPIMSI